MSLYSLGDIEKYFEEAYVSGEREKTDAGKTIRK